MISGILSSLQAIQAGERKVSEIANNIANVNTPGYRKPGTDSPAIAESPDEQAVSNVSLSEEFVALTQTKHSIEVNAKVLHVQQELEKSILDIIA